jgi:hypothetical protein
LCAVKNTEYVESVTEADQHAFCNIRKARYVLKVAVGRIIVIEQDWSYSIFVLHICELISTYYINNLLFLLKLIQLSLHLLAFLVKFGIQSQFIQLFLHQLTQRLLLIIWEIIILNIRIIRIEFELPFAAEVVERLKLLTISQSAGTQTAEQLRNANLIYSILDILLLDLIWKYIIMNIFQFYFFGEFAVDEKYICSEIRLDVAVYASPHVERYNSYVAELRLDYNLVKIERCVLLRRYNVKVIHFVLKWNIIYRLIAILLKIN